MKIPNTRVQSISGWWTYWGVARVVCLERAWKLYPTPLPIHTRLMVCIFSIWLFLYNRPLNVSNMLSWILWAILTNYGTGAGAGMWEPLIYSQSFRSMGDSGLAIGVRSWEAALWDWVLNLWGLWWLWVVGVRIELNYAGSDCKESVCNSGDPGLIPGLGRSPGEGNGYTLKYSCLENPMDWGAWCAMALRVAKSQTWLSN